MIEEIKKTNDNAYYNRIVCWILQAFGKACTMHKNDVQQIVYAVVSSISVMSDWQDLQSQSVRIFLNEWIFKNRTQKQTQLLLDQIYNQPQTEHTNLLYHIVKACDCVDKLEYDLACYHLCMCVRINTRTYWAQQDNLLKHIYSNIQIKGVITD